MPALLRFRELEQQLNQHLRDWFQKRGLQSVIDPAKLSEADRDDYNDFVCEQAERLVRDYSDQQILQMLLAAPDLLGQLHYDFETLGRIIRRAVADGLCEPRVVPS